VRSSLLPTNSPTPSDVVKLPAPDLDKIRDIEPQTWTGCSVLWRLHETRGNHPLEWNELRRFGPLRSARFDPWIDDPAMRDEGVGYFGSDVAACLAEVFQETRHIDALNSGFHLSAFTATRELVLLDLRGGYPIAVGASHSLNGGNRLLCRRWSHAFRTVYPEIDGYVYAGMTGRNCMALFDPALSAFPDLPEFTRAISDTGLAARLADAAQDIGYTLNV